MNQRGITSYLCISEKKNAWVRELFHSKSSLTCDLNPPPPQKKKRSGVWAGRQLYHLWLTNEFKIDVSVLSTFPYWQAFDVVISFTIKHFILWYSSSRSVLIRWSGTKHKSSALQEACIEWWSNDSLILQPWKWLLGWKSYFYFSSLFFKTQIFLYQHWYFIMIFWG